MNDTALLEIRDLELTNTQTGHQILHGINLRVDRGEALGLVGESGSGKSMTVRSVMRLLPDFIAVSGQVDYHGQSVLRFDRAQLRRFRSHEVAMVFQDPRAHINPIHTIGDFLTEGLICTHGVSSTAARKIAVDLLDEVGVSQAQRRMRQRPWELSGGLLQRVMIAAALAIEPKLLLADEPTTALDVTTQEEVMAIIDELRRERELALMFITHDLSLASAVCDRIAVIKDGRVVDDLPANELRNNASDPYTRDLLAAQVYFDPLHGAATATNGEEPR